MTINLITPLTKKSILFSDFFKDLTLNPLSGDLAVRTNEEAIKESLKNLILINKGERLFQPNLGGDIRALLFENGTPAILKILQDKIRYIITNYEPRVEIISINVNPDLLDNSIIEIQITFSVRNQEQPVTVNILIERTR